MRKVLIDQDIPLGGSLRLIKRLWKVEKGRNFPKGLEFSFQLLHFNGARWVQIARIDNQMHEGKPGTHIHAGKKARWEDISFQDAEKRIMEAGRRALNENRDC